MMGISVGRPYSTATLNLMMIWFEFQIGVRQTSFQLDVCYRRSDLDERSAFHVQKIPSVVLWVRADERLPN